MSTPRTRDRATRVRRRAGWRLRPAGWVLLIALVLVLLAAWNTGTNLLYIVVGGLCSFLLISFVLAGWSLLRVRASREAPDAVHRGEPFSVTLRLENRKTLVPAMSIRVEHRAPVGHNGAKGFGGYIVKIPPRRAALVRLSERFDRRGVHPLPALDLVSAFPFGLFERRRRARDGHEVVVYPRVRAVRPGALQQLSGAGAAPTFVRGHGDEFFSLRDYIPGDDVRQVAWRVSAHRGALTVREFARQTSRSIVFVLDTHRRTDLEGFDDAFEDAVELVASLAVTFLNQQYTVSIVTPGRRLPEGEGNTHRRKALDMLARVEPADGVSEGGYGWFSPGAESGRASYVFVSPDPRDWGRVSHAGRTRVIDPREVVRA